MLAKYFTFKFITRKISKIIKNAENYRNKNYIILNKLIAVPV